MLQATPRLSGTVTNGNISVSYDSAAPNVSAIVVVYKEGGLPTAITLNYTDAQSLLASLQSVLTSIQTAITTPPIVTPAPPGNLS